ncbi:hypothetical protein VPH35_113400 [Triticum aestivum]
MAFLLGLAFAFARFVAREQPRFRLPPPLGKGARRIFGLAAVRRRNFECHHQHHLNRNGGLRRHSAPYCVPLRRYGSGGGLFHRHAHHQRLHCAPGPSTRADAPREEVLVMPQEAAVAPNTVDEQVAAVLNVAAEDEDSASNITIEVELTPPLPVYASMEWMLAGPSAGWIVNDPDCYFSGKELAVQPLLMYSCPGYGYGSSLPSPTPSDEDAEHFNPPGYDPLPEFSSPLAPVPLDELKPRLFINLLPKVKTEEIEAVAPTPALPAHRDLNLPALEVEEEEHQEAAPPFALPTPSPEARVLLRHFASAMAARPAGTRAGTWSPEALGLTGRVADLCPNEAAPNSAMPLKEPAMGTSE